MDDNTVATLHTWDDLHQLIKRAGGNLVVINFYATWSAPCRSSSLIFRRMTRRFTGVIFAEVDIDENAETAETFRLDDYPTFIFIKQAEVVARLEGADVSTLFTLLKTHSR
ncbi:unnamed protein product [Dicrocoelium dendriticum]|nr:unnamed protein product [Dicrocoelium dendriticum]